MRETPRNRARFGPTPSKDRDDGKPRTRSSNAREGAAWARRDRRGDEALAGSSLELLAMIDAHRAPIGSEIPGSEDFRLISIVAGSLQMRTIFIVIVDTPQHLLRKVIISKVVAAGLSLFAQRDRRARIGGRDEWSRVPRGAHALWSFVRMHSL